MYPPTPHPTPPTQTSQDTLQHSRYYTVTKFSILDLFSVQNWQTSIEEFSHVHTVSTVTTVSLPPPPDHSNHLYQTLQRIFKVLGDHDGLSQREWIMEQRNPSHRTSCQQLSKTTHGHPLPSPWSSLHHNTLLWLFYHVRRASFRRKLTDIPPWITPDLWLSEIAQTKTNNAFWSATIRRKVETTFQPDEAMKRTKTVTLEILFCFEILNSKHRDTDLQISVLKFISTKQRSEIIFRNFLSDWEGKHCSIGNLRTKHIARIRHRKDSSIWNRKKCSMRNIKYCS